MRLCSLHGCAAPQQQLLTSRASERRARFVRAKLQTRIAPFAPPSVFNCTIDILSHIITK